MAENLISRARMVFSRMATALLAAAFLLLLLSCHSPRLLTLQGNAALRRGDLTESVVKYTSALAAVKSPETASGSWLHYDLGTAYFLLGETEGAEDQWLAISESAPGRLRFVTDYNLGLLYYNLRDFSQSEDRFRRALKLNPGDRDSKINLELALRGRKALEEQPGGESRQAEVPPLSLNRMENILERLKSLETMGSGKPLPDQGAGGPGDW